MYLRPAIEGRGKDGLFAILGLLAGQLATWPSVEAMKKEVEGWYFVRNAEDVPGFIWLAFCELKRSAFEAMIKGLIESGTDLVARLIRAVASDGFGYSIEEVTRVIMAVHSAVCELRARLHWVTTGLVNEYPDILLPK